MAGGQWRAVDGERLMESG